MAYERDVTRAPSARVYTEGSPEPGVAVSNDTRMETLEFKVAHLERALQELSDALYRQQLQLDAQASRLRQLGERVDTSSPGETAPKFEIPPHY